MTELRRWIVAVGVATLISSGALANTTLTRVQVVDANQVSLAFDRPLSKHQIQTEYLRDIVQITLQDVTVYPAKIQSVNGQEFSKLFAYQFAPSVVRFRITVKGKAEDYKGRVNVVADGQSLNIQFAQKPVARSAPGQAPAKSLAVAPKAAAAPKAKHAQEVAEHETNKMSESEKALLEKVLNSTPTADKTAEKSAGKTEEKALDKIAEKSDRLTTSKAQTTSPRLGREEKRSSSPLRPMAVTLGLLGLLGGLVLFIRRVRGRAVNVSQMKGALAKSQGITGWLKSRVKSKAPTIEVLANHYLGPKKSISVVKVYGKVLVLGVTNESINLISQLNAQANESETLDSLEQFMNIEAEESVNSSISNPKGPDPFSKVLGQEAAKPKSSVRSQIRSKLENLKTL